MPPPTPPLEPAPEPPPPPPPPPPPAAAQTTLALICSGYGSTPMGLSPTAKAKVPADNNSATLLDIARLLQACRPHSRDIRQYASARETPAPHLSFHVEPML